MARWRVYLFVAFLSSVCLIALGCTAGSGSDGAGGSAPEPVQSGIAMQATGGFVLTFGNYPMTCTTALLMPSDCAPWWNLQTVLPTSALTDGVAHPIMLLGGLFSAKTPQQQSPQCGSGGGTFIKGTIQVISHTADHLTVAVAGVGDSFTSSPVPPDGTYTMPICASAPRSDDGPAIALLASQTPGYYGSDSVESSTVVGGSQIDPNTLLILFGSEDQSCADLYHNTELCAVPEYQIALTLSPSQQTIGPQSLVGLGTLIKSGGGIGPPGACGGGGASYGDGMIDITAIDANKVTFTLSGTAPISGQAGSPNADGTYSAPRCP